MTPEEVPAELVELAEARLVEEYGGHGWPGDVGARELLAEVLTRWEEIRPYSCSFDCSYCRADDDCPCDLVGCACGGPSKVCEPVPCPPFEDVTPRVVELRTSSPRVTGFAEPHGFEDEGDDEYDDDGVDNLT